MWQFQDPSIQRSKVTLKTSEQELHPQVNIAIQLHSGLCKEKGQELPLVHRLSCLKPEDYTKSPPDPKNPRSHWQSGRQHLVHSLRDGPLSFLSGERLPFLGLADN